MAKNKYAQACIPGFIFKKLNGKDLLLPWKLSQTKFKLHKKYFQS